MKKRLPLVITLLVGILIWFYPRPAALTEQAWHAFAIFAATIVGIIIRPLPIGAISMIALAVVTATGVLSIDEALVGYSRGPIWLIVIAFFISRGFIKTGLGTRIAYLLVQCFGKSSLGLAYSLAISEVMLAPAIPSITARTGGIIYPIANALCLSLGSQPENTSARKIGKFLITVCFQISIISSALFLTAMAANPIIVDLASGLGVTITWGKWLLASCIPGAVSFLLIPLIVYKIHPPELKHLPNAKQFAKDRLAAMGPMQKAEWIMLLVFIGLVVLWVLGDIIGVNSLTTALIGVGILLITEVLNFSELLEEKSAWDTFLWFGALLTLASSLNQFGVIGYFSSQMASLVQGLSWPTGLLVLGLVYFYSHYFFASSMAHVGAMFAAFFSVTTLLGAPPYATALLFAFFSNLFGGLTHYGIGCAPVLFGGGYLTTTEWWKAGFIVSVCNIIIWTVVGGMWWKFLGIW